LIFDNQGFIELKPGSYMITYNEIVQIPTTLMAWHGTAIKLLAFCGSALHGGLGMPVISGRSHLMIVYNSAVSGYKKTQEWRSWFS